MQSTKVTLLPYIPPVKRKPETSGFVVKYASPDDDTIYFRWFKRDTPAVKFLNKMVDDGYVATIIMK